MPPSWPRSFPTRSRNASPTKSRTCTSRLANATPRTGRVPVIVIERARIDARLAELRAAGLYPAAIYSQASLLPAMPGQLIALLDGDALILRSADSVPLVMPALSLDDAFEMALGSQMSAVPGLEAAPPGLLLYAGHDEWQAHQDRVDAWRDRFTGVKVQLLPDGPLSVLAPAAAGSEAINMLQGPLAVASPLETGWRAWRIAAVLAGVLLCLHLGSRYFELRGLNKQEATLNAGIEEAFRAAMPGTAERHQRPRTRRAAAAGSQQWWRRHPAASPGGAGSRPQRGAQHHFRGHQFPRRRAGPACHRP